MKAEEFPDLKANFDEIKENIEEALAATHNSFEKDGKVIEYYRAFEEHIVEKIINSMATILDLLGGILYEEGPSEDTPISFLGTDLCDHLSILSEEEGVTQFLDFLITLLSAKLERRSYKTWHKS
ncbi:hypothetical protein H8E77_00275, partial [bacterium]|nr:hypothetical protein [bacterium]